MTSSTRLATVANPDFEVVMFMQPNGGAELVVSSLSRVQSRFMIAPPPKGRRIVMRHNPDGSVEVEYRDA